MTTINGSRNEPAQPDKYRWRDDARSGQSVGRPG
jgi:hypothetical protein